MAYFLFKTLMTALLIAGVSELSKRFTFLSSLLAAVPLTSILIFVWMYIEQKDVEKISSMSVSIFYLVIPSLIFFLVLPFFLRKGVHFYLSLLVSAGVTFAVYAVYMKALKVFKIEI